MFLQPHRNTIPTVQRDYPEWHRGRKKYALWYLEIEDTGLLNYLHDLRHAFSDVLFQPIHRQFHISLYICGFLTDQAHIQQNDDFLRKQLQRQLADLQQRPSSAFKLHVSQIQSFESALMLEIEDPSGKLIDLRHRLAEHAVEIAPLDYCAHITLGVYRAAYRYADIYQRIAAIRQQTFEIEVNHLTFGCYQPHILQGPLFAEQHIQLDKPCYN